LWAYNQ